MTLPGYFLAALYSSTLNDDCRDLGLKTSRTRLDKKWTGNPMAIGYYIGLGDKTDCGGQVLEGDASISWDGVIHALEGHLVTCGKDGKAYQIFGGVSSFTNNGRRVAGTLDSFSGCPCRAQLIPSIFTATYVSEERSAPQATKATPQPMPPPDNRFATPHQWITPNGVSKSKHARSDMYYPPRAPAHVSVDSNMQAASMERHNFKNGGDAFLFSWFYTKVRNGGEWDYKQKGRDFEAFGNFNYGACGTAAGISEEVLLRAAGWAQSRAGTSNAAFGQWWGDVPYGDDPQDQKWIKAGIAYAKSLGY